MKRILIFSIAYEPYIGGAELAARNITDRLFTSPTGGPSYRFDLITSKFKRGDRDQEKIGNVNVYRVGFGGRLGRYLYPWFASRLAQKLHQQNRYNLVWSIMAAYAGAAALLFLNKHKRMPFLLTLQEGDAIEHIHKKVRFFRSAWQEVFKRANYIQAISTFLANWAKSEGAVCPVEVISNGVDLNKFKIQNSKSKNENQNSKFTIITTSRLVHKNGIDILIKAIARLKKDLRPPISGLRLQILGEGQDRKDLERLARDLGAHDVIQFLGHINPDELPEYYQKADIFVRPSRSEGLGISFLEAMAVGLPVIATNVGGIPDFLRDRETGLFTKSEDADDLAEKIKQLYEDENLRKTLSQNGRDLIEMKYDWDKVAKEMSRIFSKL